MLWHCAGYAGVAQLAAFEKTPDIFTFSTQLCTGVPMRVLRIHWFRGFETLRGYCHYNNIRGCIGHIHHRLASAQQVPKQTAQETFGFMGLGL